MKQIAIYGAGGFGRELAWLIECSSTEQNEYTVACFIDDNEKIHGKVINDIPVLGLKAAKHEFPHAYVVGSVPQPKVRQTMMEKAAAEGFIYETLIAPSVQRSRSIDVGVGTIICAGCVLTTNIVIGAHVQINLNCTIGHDVILEDYVTLAPGVLVSGYVHLGKRVYVGTGATFVNGTLNDPIMVGDDVIIDAGACVTNSILLRGVDGERRQKPESKSTRVDRFKSWEYPQIEDGKLTQYNWMVQHKDKLQLGYNTDIGAFSYINAKYGVIIEDDVQIGSHCSIYSVSTIDGKNGPVILKKNCKVGTHSVVMPGVTIGENAIIGAFSYVNKDVPSNMIVFGIPAKVVRKLES